MGRLRSYTAVLLAAVICLLTGCGEQAAPSQAHYDQVLDTLTSAVSLGDTDAYLLCFTEAARLNYKQSASYNKELAGTLAAFEDGRRLALICTVSEHRELNEGEINMLTEAYKEKYAMRINITKAYELKARFSSGSSNAERTLNVVNNGSGWLILGPVIERIFDGTGA